MEKNNIMMIVIIALLVILLGTIGFMSVYLINFFSENEENTVIVDGEVIQIPQDQLLTVVFEDSVRGLIREPNGGSHAITFRVSVAINNSNSKEQKAVNELSLLLAEREQVVKSWISDIIYNYSHQDYDSSPDGMKATLSKEILERMRLEFGTNLIHEVYLSDYLYQ